MTVFGVISVFINFADVVSWMCSLIYVTQTMHFSLWALKFQNKCIYARPFIDLEYLGEYSHNKSVMFSTRCPFKYCIQCTIHVHTINVFIYLCHKTRILATIQTTGSMFCPTISYSCMFMVQYTPTHILHMYTLTHTNTVWCRPVSGCIFSSSF